MDNMKHRRLQELDRSDFEIVDGEPDIRGWDVKSDAGKKIGEVEELIVDAKNKKVRYMVVDLDDNELDLDDRKVLIPIGLAQLHKDDDDVIISGVEAAQLNGLPVYEKDHLDGEVEKRISSTFGRTASALPMASDQESSAEFYQHDHFNDDNLYKNRLQELKKDQKKQSEYESGLRLWERRSDGGILENKETRDRNITGNSSRNENYRERELEEKERLELVKNRRNNYEEQRGRDISSRGDSHTDRSVERRIRDEGLNDAL